MVWYGLRAKATDLSPLSGTLDFYLSAAMKKRAMLALTNSKRAR